MSDDETRGYVSCLWMVVGILIFTASMHKLSISKLTERVDALEQSRASETQQ